MKRYSNLCGRTRAEVARGRWRILLHNKHNFTGRIISSRERIEERHSRDVCTMTITAEKTLMHEFLGITNVHFIQWENGLANTQVLQALALDAVSSALAGSEAVALYLLSEQMLCKNFVKYWYEEMRLFVRRY
jgi:hypothetical protein